MYQNLVFQNLVFLGSVCLIGFLLHRIIKEDQATRDREVEELSKITPDQSPSAPPVGSPNWKRNRISQYFDSPKEW